MRQLALLIVLVATLVPTSGCRKSGASGRSGSAANAAKAIETPVKTEEPVGFPDRNEEFRFIVKWPAKPNGGAADVNIPNRKARMYSAIINPTGGVNRLSGTLRCGRRL